MTREIELTEKDIKMKQLQMEEYEIKSAKMKIQKDQLEKSIKEELPMKEARLILRQINSEIENAEQNIKTLAKHIREKKMIINQ